MKNPNEQLSFSILAEVIPVGDGLFRVKPKPTEKDGDTWVPIKKAVPIISQNINWRSVHNLKNQGFLVYRKPLKGRVEISLHSLEAYKAATNNPDFWDDATLQEALKKEVAKQMAILQGKKPASDSGIAKPLQSK